MGHKSRLNFPTKGCLGCEDNGTDRCINCLGRPQDKRKKILSKGVDNDREDY